MLACSSSLPPENRTARSEVFGIVRTLAAINSLAASVFVLSAVLAASGPRGEGSLKSCRFEAGPSAGGATLGVEKNSSEQGELAIIAVQSDVGM